MPKTKSVNETYSHTNNVQLNGYTTRTVMHLGRQHLIVPVVMLVEGVHVGNNGAFLYEAAQLMHCPPAWNGRPVIIHHPEEGSANIPEVMDNEVIGRIYNTEWDGERLVAEAWIDELKLSSINPEVLAILQAGESLEVSTGVYTDNEIVTGTWNDEEYIGIARNYRPDHLAFLPGARGACSIADGCGVRNQEGGGVVPKVKKDEQALKLNDTIKSLAAKGYFVTANAAMGFQELAGVIQEKLDMMDTDMRIHFLEELYEDHFIYRVVIRMGDRPSMSRLFKRSYTQADDGVVTFGEDTTPVNRQVEYVEINGAQENLKIEEGSTEMPKKNEEKSCCPKRVDALIQNNHTGFGEDDKEWLNNLSEVELGKIEDLAEAPETDTPPAVENVVEKNEEGSTMDSAQAMQVLKTEWAADPSKFMDLLPIDARAQINRGVKLDKALHAELVDKIVTNSNGVYNAEELKVMDTTVLEKMAAAIGNPTDFSAAGNVQSLQSNTTEHLLPSGVTEVKE